MSETDDYKSKCERLEGQQRQLDERRWAELFSGMSEIKTSVTEIKTNCVTCRKTTEDHHALLYGDPHAGTSGLAQSVKTIRSQTEDVHVALFGGEGGSELSIVSRVNTLHVRQEKMAGRVNLLWKGVVSAVAAAGAAVAALVVKK